MASMPTCMLRLILRFTRFFVTFSISLVIYSSVIYDSLLVRISMSRFYGQSMLVIIFVFSVSLKQ